MAKPDNTADTNTLTLRRVNDVAREWGVCGRTIWRLIDSGELEAVKILGSTRIPTKSLEAYLAKAPRRRARLAA